ncbi:hypothetical protein BV081_01566A, partial [Haemophilus influenzae]
MNSDYIFEQLTSYSLEDIILKLLYFFISLVTSHYFSKL